jgi:ubiquinol-cytochrome c reductase cytochrome b subunit
MGTAFLGYVLPWGQIRFWGATVITNLICVIPKLGTIIVNIFWGGFAVENSSLTRFFTLHFLLPFIIAGISGIHLFLLHLSGSNNPLGLNQNSDKVKFNPYFTWKDIIGVLFVFQILLILVAFYPWLLGDPENFIPANPYITPIHIQPEWYFLFAYAILRRIPNKLGGVIALVMSVAIFYTLPFINHRLRKSKIFTPINKFLFWVLVRIIVILTWIGARPVENPYIITGQVLTVVYFIWFILNSFILRAWITKI